jgi:hypothetical protein
VRVEPVHDRFCKLRGRGVLLQRILHLLDRQIVAEAVLKGLASQEYTCTTPATRRCGIWRGTMFIMPNAESRIRLISGFTPCW